MGLGVVELLVVSVETPFVVVVVFAGVVSLIRAAYVVGGCVLWVVV